MEIGLQQRAINAHEYMTELAGLLIKCAQLLEGNQISGKEMLQASAPIAPTAIALN